MGLLVLIILIAAAVSGTLWGVLEIAAGVALGLFLFVLLVAVTGYWMLRRRMGRWDRGAPPRY
jgi:membrane protein implicated in regulation of membrane protease activity